MRIARFHETWNGGQLSAERWLTAYIHYYKPARSVSSAGSPAHYRYSDNPTASTIARTIAKEITKPTKRNESLSKRRIIRPSP